MKYVIDKSQRPAYLQIYKLLKNDIVEGVFAYNTPSISAYRHECIIRLENNVLSQLKLAYILKKSYLCHKNFVDII